jgi:hypothetical protein
LFSDLEVDAVAGAEVFRLLHPMQKMTVAAADAARADKNRGW